MLSLFLLSHLVLTLAVPHSLKTWSVWGHRTTEFGWYHQYNQELLLTLTHKLSSVEVTIWVHKINKEEMGDPQTPFQSKQRWDKLSSWHPLNDGPAHLEWKFESHLQLCTWFSMWPPLPRECSCAHRSRYSKRDKTATAPTWKVNKRTVSTYAPWKLQTTTHCELLPPDMW